MHYNSKCKEITGAPGKYGRGRRAGKETTMKITEKELLFLAAIGACHESTFFEDHKDFGKAKQFNEIMKALIEAKSLADLVDNPT